MLNARHSFTLVWQRLVAALSLAAAAVLAPALSAPAGGMGALGSRAGSGAAVASPTGAAGAGAANIAAGLAEGAQHRLLDGMPGAPEAKALAPPPRREIAVLVPETAPPLPDAGTARPTHAPRAGLTRAPPAA